MIRKALALSAALLLSAGAPASAWEARTHAGLTEGAALASTLHRLFAERLGRPLGLYEPLTLAHAKGDGELERRLTALDPAGGYAPESGANTALGWLTAGAVVEGVPAARNANHFFDPSSGSGLAAGGFGVALRTRASDVAQGIGTVRGLATGASFGGSGHAAPAWVLAPRAQNSWGLARFLDERERAAAAPTSAERDDALARALLAAGSIVHVVEDMGDPTYLTADYRAAVAGDRAGFERAVDAAFARLAVPPPAGLPPSPTRLVDLIHAQDGSGLADRAFRMTAAARAAGRFDPASASALLPMVGRYAESTLEWLFRGQLGLEASAQSLTAVAHGLPLGAGEVAIYADDAKHLRKRIAARDLHGASEGALLLSADRPDWARHATAIFRGVDAAGAPIVIVQEQPLR